MNLVSATLKAGRHSVTIFVEPADLAKIQGLTQPKADLTPAKPQPKAAAPKRSAKPKTQPKAAPAPKGRHEKTSAKPVIPALSEMTTDSVGEIFRGIKLADGKNRRIADWALAQGPDGLYWEFLGFAE